MIFICDEKREKFQRFFFRVRVVASVDVVIMIVVAVGCRRRTSSSEKCSALHGDDEVSLSGS